MTFAFFQTLHFLRTNNFFFDSFQTLIFFFSFLKIDFEKKNFAFAHFVNSRLFEWKKRWEKKNDFVVIDKLSIIVLIFEKSLTDIVKSIVFKRVARIVIEFSYRKIKNRSICKIFYKIFYKIFEYFVNRNENICVWKLFKKQSNTKNNKCKTKN